MSGTGSVILVGAGPGDPGLMTLRGKQALEEADAVLYDRLVGEDIIAMIPDSAIKVDVGKESGRHRVPQREINELLLRWAREGRRVVRLKGGDPYLFGRGAEELEALAAERIPFRVVPGVTSATAVPAYAGIPASHRDISSSVHIVTAHKKNGAAPGLDYKSLAGLGGTLIFLMGLSTIEAITNGLIGAGMSPETPAALIENGTSPGQRKLVCAVSEISSRAREMGFRPPSVLVVGGVCALSDRLDWFSRLPLVGASVIVTRPKARSELARELRELGAQVIDLPCIRTRPVPLAAPVLEHPARWGWIVFTSPTGAEVFFDELKARDIDIRAFYPVAFAAIGPKTAAAVTARGVRVDYQPEIYNARELAAGLPMREGFPKTVLLFRAQAGGGKLVSALRARGFEAEDAAAYETVRESPNSGRVREMLAQGDASFIAFTSASSVRAFTDCLPGLNYSGLTAVCIGGETAAQAEKHGFRALISEEATVGSMIKRIREEWRK